MLHIGPRALDLDKPEAWFWYHDNGLATTMRVVSGRPACASGLFEQRDGWIYKN